MFDSLNKWFDKKMRVDAYELRGDEIVAPGFPKRRIKLRDVRTWQSFYIGGGVPSVCVEFADGGKIGYSDKYEHLFRILHEIAEDRELPFFKSRRVPNVAAPLHTPHLALDISRRLL